MGKENKNAPASVSASASAPAAPPVEVTDEPIGVPVPGAVDPTIAEAAKRVINAPVEEVDAVIFGPHSGKILVRYLPEKDSPKDEDIRKMVVYKKELGYQVKITDARLIKAMKATGHQVMKEDK